MFSLSFLNKINILKSLLFLSFILTLYLNYYATGVEFFWLTMYNFGMAFNIFYTFSYKHIKYADLELYDNETVNILIPMYNEEKMIINTLDALNQQSYKGKIILTVVDDCSSDNCVKLVNDYVFSSSNITKKVIVRKHNSGYKAIPMNDGIEQIFNSEHNEGLMFILDSDTILDQAAIRNSVTFMQHNPDKSGACGVVVMKPGHKDIDTSLQRSKASFISLKANLFLRYFQWIEHLSCFHAVKSGRARYGLVSILSGAFSVVRLDALKPEKVGKFGHNIVEDICWTWRAYLKKCKLGYINDAVALTGTQNTYTTFSNQRKRWARGPLEAIKDARKLHPLKTYLFLPNVIFNHVFCISLILSIYVAIDNFFLWLLVNSIYAFFLNGISMLYLLDILNIRRDIKVRWYELFVPVIMIPLLGWYIFHGGMQELFNKEKKWMTR